MKVDFIVNCKNPSVIFAISDALKAAGFNVHGCGVMLSTGEPDLECTPPIDFVDSVPDAFVPMLIQAGGYASLQRPDFTAPVNRRPWWQFWK